MWWADSQIYGGSQPKSACREKTQDICGYKFGDLDGAYGYAGD